MKNREKLVFIDYLRVFSMLYVVGFWHLFEYTNASVVPLFNISEKITWMVLGVFTFISGFLIGKSVVRSSNLLDFYTKRIIRIYPLYLVAVILFFVYGLNSADVSLKSLFLVSMVYGPAPRTLWFITMIILFYLAAPFLSKLINRPKQYILLVLLTLFTMVAANLFGSADIRLALYFPSFCIGLYCAQKGIENQFFNIRLGIAFLVIGLLLYATKFDSGTIENLKQIPFIASSSYLVFALSHRKQKYFGNNSLILFLSYASYGMYLFHRPVYATLKSIYFPKDQVPQVIYLVGFCLVILTLISWSSQQLNDRLYAVSSAAISNKPKLWKR